MSIKTVFVDGMVVKSYVSDSLVEKTWGIEAREAAQRARDAKRGLRAGAHQQEATPAQKQSTNTGSSSVRPDEVGAVVGGLFGPIGAYVGNKIGAQHRQEKEQKLDEKPTGNVLQRLGKYAKEHPIATALALAPAAISAVGGARNFKRAYNIHRQINGMNEFTQQMNDAHEQHNRAAAQASQDAVNAAVGM